MSVIASVRNSGVSARRELTVFAKLYQNILTLHFLIFLFLELNYVCVKSTLTWKTNFNLHVAGPITFSLR